MIIIIDNIQSQVVIGGNDYIIDVDIISFLRKNMRVRKKGYERTSAYRNRRWDGYTYLINKKGFFATGFLPYIIKLSDKLGVSIFIEDSRKNLPQFKDGLIKEVGNGWTGRDYQLDALKSANKWYSYKDYNIYFPRGGLNAATNSGKMAISALLLNNMNYNKCIYLVDRALNAKQTFEFFSEFIPNTTKFFGGKEDLSGNLVIAMVQTLYNRTSSVNVIHKLSEFDLLIVDEAHRAASNTYIKTMTKINAGARYFMSGTLYENADKYTKAILTSNSGDLLYKIANKDLIDEGVSIDPLCKIYLNDDYKSVPVFNWVDAYNKLVIYSESRLNIIKDIINDGKSTLIAVKLKKHGEFLKRNLGGVCEFIHGEDPNTQQKLESFARGDLKVLISTTITQESLNIPIIERIIYARGGKDKVSVKQYYGRGARQNESGSLEWVDFYDVGEYVSKHSRSRIKLLKKEGFKLNFNYKHNSQYTPI